MSGVSIDTLTISSSGATLMTGWSNDQFDPLTEIHAYEDLDRFGPFEDEWLRGNVTMVLYRDLLEEARRRLEAKASASSAQTVTRRNV